MADELLKKLQVEVGDKLPRHIGIIPDGNRRWARSQGLDIKIGHLNGYKTLKDIF